MKKKKRFWKTELVGFELQIHNEKVRLIFMDAGFTTGQDYILNFI